MTTEIGHPANSTPKVSIGLPVYNGEQFLKQTLKSLLNQTYQNIEIIISDNDSTDNTSEICMQFAEQDARIRYHRNTKNMGANWNFNQVFHLSTGEYFKWAAADDLCEPDFIERCVAVLEDDPEVVCCHALTQKIDINNNVLEQFPDPTDGGFFSSELENRRRPDGSSHRLHLRIHDVLIYSGWGVRCFGVMRSDALRNTGLLLPYFGYEKVMMAALASQGRFYDIPEVLFYQRVHEHATSFGVNASGEYSRITIDRLYPWWKLLKGHYRNLWKFPIGIGNRLICHLWIIKYLLQIRKWIHIVPVVLREKQLWKTKIKHTINRKPFAYKQRIQLKEITS